jgi:GT2 family glycosyltransferase
LSQTNPKVAVLLAAYNGEKWLSEQLTTILYQKDVDVTIFISIDPSSDASESVCEIHAKQYSNIKLLSVSEKFGGYLICLLAAGTRLPDQSFEFWRLRPCRR